MSVTERAPERYTLWVCRDCAQPAHGPGDRCSRDRRRTWTQMDEVEYVRADLTGEALRRYGDHDQSCGVRLGKSCSCGFAAAAGLATELHHEGGQG